jgi:hypothetical protein
MTAGMKSQAKEPEHKQDYGQLGLSKLVTARNQRSVQDSLGALLKIDVTGQDRLQQDSKGIADKARRRRA